MRHAVKMSAGWMAAFLFASALAGCGGKPAAEPPPASESAAPPQTASEPPASAETANPPASEAPASPPASAETATPPSMEGTVPPASEASAKPPASASGEGQSQLAQFRARIKDGPSSAELMRDLRIRLPDASGQEADEMVRDLIAYNERNREKVSGTLTARDAQELLADLKWPFTADQIPNIKDEKTRARVEQIVAGGYKLETAEGTVYAVVDYGALKEAFASRLSPEMNDYIALMALESDRRSMNDGALVIGWDEAAQRALAAEAFIRRYPGAAERAKAEERFLQYLSQYFIGLDNTPVYDIRTYRILPEVEKSYRKTIAEHKDTTVARLAQAWLDVLEQTQGAVFRKGKDGMQADIPEVKAFRDKLQERAKADLPEANSDK